MEISLQQSQPRSPRSGEFVVLRGRSLFDLRGGDSRNTKWRYTANSPGRAVPEAESSLLFITDLSWLFAEGIEIEGDII
jgi:hypothetical protein